MTGKYILTEDELRAGVNIAFGATKYFPRDKVQRRDFIL